MTDVVNGATVNEQETEADDWLTEIVCSAIVSVPVLAAPAFGAMLNETVPLPVLLLRPVMAIHEALLLADHAQPAGAFTETDGVSDPPAGAVTFCGVTELAQLTGGSGDACAMRTVRPAMTSEAVRASPPLELTANVTAPEPVPDAPEAMATHDASARAVQAQDACAVTLIRALPPAAPKVCSVEDTSNRHGAASWRICARTPLTSTFPCLAAASGFAPTSTRSSPAP